MGFSDAEIRATTMGRFAAIMGAALPPGAGDGAHDATQEDIDRFMQ